MKYFLALIWICSYTGLSAQVTWKDSAFHFSDIKWNNYSTTYLGPGSDKTPLLVTAIPYNGVYGFEDNSTIRTAMDMTFKGSAYKFQSNLQNNKAVLFTYDSSNVYFLAPGIFRSNAAQYEYRILEDSINVIKPWSEITTFTDPGFQLNQFRKDFAFLGGYKTTWGHEIVAQLRKKHNKQVLSQSIVYWQPVRPLLTSILTGEELNTKILKGLKSNFEFGEEEETTAGKWAKLYPATQLDTLTGLPKMLQLPAEETGLIFFVSAMVYRRQALEYQLIRDSRIVKDWQSNEVDNNYIWLRNLGFGNYQLNIRFAMQRHMVTSYHFSIARHWYQTWWFKIAGLISLTAIAGFVALLLKTKRQQRRIKEEKAKKEKFELGLRSIHAQLNPHFIFNALASIQGLINKKDIDGANRYLADFGRLVRSSLTENGKMLIPLQVELKTLQTYLRLEQLRFEFTFGITVNNLSPDTIEIPPFLLQPILENAVKHGVSAMHSRGNILVTLDKAGKDLVIIMHDNGEGFDSANPVQGYGLKLTKDRIELLNGQLTDQEIKLEIYSSKAEGTTVTVLFKNWLG